MPNDKDFVSSALSSAKNALAGAKRFTASVGDTTPSRVSPQPKPAAPAATAKPASTGIMREAEDTGAGVARNLQMKKDVLGSFKKGGTVKKTGVYKLHKDEQVIPAEKSQGLDKSLMDKATEALGKKNQDRLHMNIEPTDDGRFVVEHHYPNRMEPGKNRERHAPGSVPELLAHVAKHYAAPSAADDSTAGESDSPSKESAEKA